MSVSIEELRRSLRINGSHLDDEILALAATAEAELVRSGCSDEVVSAGGHLVRLAVKTYVKAQMSEDTTLANRHQKAFETLEDAIRRSTNVQ